MSKISSYLVIICLIFLSRWTIRVDTGEAHGSTSVDQVASSNQDDQTIPPSEKTGSFMDRSMDEQLLPQEPYPRIVAVDTEERLVPPTPSDGHVSGMGPGGTSATVSMDIKDMSSTDSNVQAGDASGVKGAAQTLILGSDIEKTKDEEKSSQNAPGDSQVIVNGETMTSQQLSPSSTVASDTDSVADPHLPALDKILENVMQTNMYDPNRAHSSHQMSSSEGGTHTFEMPLPTEALRAVTPVVPDDMSVQPELSRDNALDPHGKDDSVVPTQFSLEDEEGKKKLGEEEFPTFDKWSMQYLAEQEKQKVKKQQEHAVNPSTVLVQKKLKRNFAAKTCGAKVVASNPEAENVNFVLNKNPDEYMLSPCKAKKWFVVELCEPLQIHKVDLGTTELFASQPKSFRLSTSQRYPTKDWTPLGKFDMTLDRTIQSFSTQVNEEFVKFVRVEMLEHHGDEYYCPVTIFRVLGVDMQSDEDETNNEALDPSDEAAVVDVDEDEVEESVNLFTSAKDVVVKLVKKVLFKEEQDDVKEEHAVVDNTTAKTDENKEAAAPCSEKVKASVVDDTPTALVPEGGVISHSPVPEEPKVVPIVTKLADTEQLPFASFDTPVVIKLDKDSDTPAWDCGMCDTPSLCPCSPWNAYLQMMAYAHLQSSTCPARLKDSPPVTDRIVQATDVTTDPSNAAMSDREDAVREKLHTETLVPSQDASADAVDPHNNEDMPQKDLSQAEKDQISIDSSQRLQAENAGKAVSTNGFQQRQSASETQSSDPVVASHLTSFSSSGVSVTKSENLDPSSLFSQSEMEDTTRLVMTPDLDIQQSQVVEQGANNLAETIFLKVSPTPTITSHDSMEIDKDMLPETPTADPQAEGKAEDNMSLQPLNPDNLQGRNGHFDGQEPLNAPEQAKSQSGDKNETSNTSAARVTKSIDLVDVGVSSSSKRDTSIMKLNNRIMALEQNVSMTKKYLEELSRAFKQQNEDMMKLLNKTEKRLTSYMSQSEEKELRQQSTIDILEVKVANLTQALDSMQVQMVALGKEFRGAQFLLAVFQAVLLLWLIISSYRGHGKSALVYTDHQFLLDTMPTKPSFDRAENGSHQRRNSDVGISSGVEQGGAALKRQVSEANLASFGGSKQKSTIDGSSAFIRDPSQVSRKKKKKKLKQAQLSVDSGSSLSAASNSGSLPTQSSSFSTSAGVLFGTDNSYRAEDSLHVSNSLSKAPKMLMSAHSVKSFEKFEGAQSEQALIGRQYGSACPLVTGSKHGILVVRTDANSQNLSSSAAPVTPEIRDGVNFSWSNSFRNIDRIPVVQFNGHQSIPETAFSIPPLRDTSERIISLTTSPEFKQPVYHRNKIRKMVEATSSDHKGSTSYKIGKGRILGPDEMKRRRSAGFIHPESGCDYFLADNYLSENRFKFPATPPNSSSLEPTISSWSSTELLPVRATFTSNGSAIEDKRARLGQLVGYHSQPISSTLHDGVAPHYRSASLFSESSSFKSPARTSSWSHLHPTTTTTHISFISDQHIPQTMAQISSRELFPTPAGYRLLHDHSPQPDCVSLEPGAVIYPVTQSANSTSKPDLYQSSQAKSISHTDERAVLVTPKPEAPQSHRRQVSLPINQLRASGSFEKQSPPATRKGSFEGSKQLKKSSSGTLQGAKAKKAPVNPPSLSKRSSASKAPNSDSSTQLSFKKQT